MLDYGSSNGFGELIESTNHSIQVSCDNKLGLECETKTIVYQPQIKQPNYFIIVNFTNGQNISDTISDVQMKIGFMNSNYTVFLISLKYACLGISMVAVSLYWLSVRRLGTWKNWVFEQKFILVLGVLLIFFNDPFYAITVLMPNMAR